MSSLPRNVVARKGFEGDMPHSRLREYYKQQHNIDLGIGQFLHDIPLIFKVDNKIIKAFFTPGERKIIKDEVSHEIYSFDCTYDASTDTVHFIIYYYVKAGILDYVSECLVDRETGKRYATIYNT